MIAPFIINYQSWKTELIPILVISLFFIYILGQQRKIFEAWYMNFLKKEELNTIFESFPGGICLIENNKILKMNEEFKNTFVLDSSENSPLNENQNFNDEKKDSAILISDIRAPLKSVLHNFLEKIKNKNNTTVTEEVQLELTQNKKNNFLMTVHQISQVHNKFLLYFINIDELKTAQQMLELQQMTLINSSKMAALGQMSNGIAHEINTPLAIICSKSQQSHDRLGNGADLDKNFILTGLKKIMNTGFRIGHIISSLQRFSRESAQDPVEYISIDSLIQDSIDLCKTKFSNHNVTIEFQSKLPPNFKTHCQPGQISQVIVNLLNNSFDALIQNETPIKWIKVFSMLVDSTDKIRILIKDNGPGIPVELRDHIMNPFFTTKEIGKGTGLGLSVSKGIIESHQGKLFFNFNSKCTEVIIEIPSQGILQNSIQPKKSDVA